MPATTALVDMSLARSIGFASDAASAGASVLPLDGDIGALWYMRLVGIHGRLAGVLRASDAFVLARLASHAGHTVIEQPVLACTVEIAILMRRVVS